MSIAGSTIGGRAGRAVAISNHGEVPVAEGELVASVPRRSGRRILHRR